MSVEHEAKLTIGWRVDQCDIPDFDDRWENEWLELIPLAQRASKLRGKHTYVEDLCEEEDAWCGDTQMIGVPTPVREMTFDEFKQKNHELAELAKDVYRQVMRCEPKDGPYLISWTHVF